MTHLAVKANFKFGLQTDISYVLTTLNESELAFKLACHANLPSADDLYVKQYQQMFKYKLLQIHQE
jgi:hypothetical protein